MPTKFKVQYGGQQIDFISMLIPKIMRRRIKR